MNKFKGSFLFRPMLTALVIGGVGEFLCSYEGSNPWIGRAIPHVFFLPKKNPKVSCVTRSRTKAMIILGENCVEVSVSVISSTANTMETTVIIAVAISLRMIWATWGSFV